MPATYEPIATTTLGSAAANITFSSIPATYTDLRIITTGKTTNGTSYVLQFNNDTGTNYSKTRIYAYGTGVISQIESATANATLAYTSNTNGAFAAFDIFNYAGSTNKTFLCAGSQDENGSGSITRAVGLWRNTTAISSIKLIAFSDSFATGTTATLYGILKA